MWSSLGASTSRKAQKTPKSTVQFLGKEVWHSSMPGKPHMVLASTPGHGLLSEMVFPQAQPVMSWESACPLVVELIGSL